MVVAITYQASSTDGPETVDQVLNVTWVSNIITQRLCLRQVTLFGYCW